MAAWSRSGFLAKRFWSLATSGASAAWVRGARLGDCERQQRCADEHGEQRDRDPGAGRAEQRTDGGIEQGEQVLGELDGREHGEPPSDA
jgi:hypothetical protein